MGIVSFAGYSSGAAEDFRLPECEDASRGRRIPTLRTSQRHFLEESIAVNEFCV